MSLHALIVDDNVSNVEALQALLHREDIACTTLISPIDLPELLETLEPVDIVFLDLEFPNDNGFDILEHLQADPRMADVPFVAYTVHISEQNEARQAGFHSFLGKPLDVHKFPEQLRRILSGERVWEI
ncbi:MAG: response regulator [Anaerolineae bacterium]|nr:response regulator [Anaerolineae bacterium]